MRTSSHEPMLGEIAATCANALKPPKAATDSASAEVVDLVEDTSESDRPPHDRHPFPSELEFLLRSAPPELAPIVRVILEVKIPARLACRALIEDFNPAAGTLEVEGRSYWLPDHLAELISRMIGDRRAGPLFVRPTGRPWAYGTLRDAFRDARNAAGLPRDLVLVGRHNNAKGRSRKTRPRPLALGG